MHSPRNLRRRQLEADYQVAKAKGDMRQITLYAQVGYTGTDKGFQRLIQSSERQPGCGSRG